MLAGIDLALDHLATDAKAQVAFRTRRDHTGVGALLRAGSFDLGDEYRARSGALGRRCRPGCYSR